MFAVATRLLIRCISAVNDCLVASSVAAASDAPSLPTFTNPGRLTNIERRKARIAAPPPTLKARPVDVERYESSNPADAIQSRRMPEAIVRSATVGRIMKRRRLLSPAITCPATTGEERIAGTRKKVE